MKILEQYTDEQVRELALQSTPDPMYGTWILRAPDGRSWNADSPLKCVSQEMQDRVPPIVQLARIRLSLADSMEVRLAIMARVNSKEITLEQAKDELKKIKQVFSRS